MENLEREALAPPFFLGRWQVHVHGDWHGVDWSQLGQSALTKAAGRGALTRMDHPRGILLWRCYRHGGLRRFFLAAEFGVGTRASHEYETHRRAFEQGLSVPEPIGWAEAKGVLLLTRHYAFLVHYLEDSQTLAHLLATTPYMPISFVNQGVQLLVGLFRLGIAHTDLNLKNWLVSRGRLYLIDFDKAGPQTMSAEDYVVACCARLVRSAWKLGLARRQWLRPWIRLIWQACRAMGVAPRPVLQRLEAHLRSPSLVKRVGWFLGGGHRHAKDHP